LNRQAAVGVALEASVVVQEILVDLVAAAVELPLLLVALVVQIKDSLVEIILIMMEEPLVEEALLL
jgi:hypothetical protein